MTSVDFVAAVAIAAIGQMDTVSSSAGLIWVAIFSFTIPSMIAAVSATVSAHRSGPHSTIQKDVEYVKELMVNHVNNKRIHQRQPRKDNLDG